MKPGTLFSLLYRKYPAFRAVLYACLIGVGVAVVSAVTVNAKRVPVIASVEPPVGAPGDIMSIDGTHFGEQRGSSYVEIGGSRITGSNYVQWSDRSIRLVLPSNVQDGLVFVVTQAGRSKPEFFANEKGIPVAVPPDTKTLLPVILTISPDTGRCGDLVTISGTNFGTIRGESAVFFSANRDDADPSKNSLPEHVPGELDVQFIPANEQDYDYEYWSDNEIRVRIPDGAGGGMVVVQTDKGQSAPARISVTSSHGTKSFSDRKMYVIRVNADVDSIDTKNATNITLRVPCPVVTAQQPMAELTNVSPAPVILNYKNTVIHQIELQKASSQSKKITFTQDFVVSTYSVRTHIDARQVKPFAETGRVLYRTATAADSLVQSGDADIAALAGRIVGAEANPYVQARLIYDYMISTFRLLTSVRKADANPADLLRRKSGDAYDFAIIYTALLRACGIPALPVGGILVDADLQSKNHWWAEFYLEHYGWIPVDVALGLGMEYHAFAPPEDARDFYFGNLDGQHIAFSRGWNDIKPSLSNSKTVGRPRSYALQSIWEESSAGNVNYSSLWNDPLVLGVF